MSDDHKPWYEYTAIIGSLLSIFVICMVINALFPDMSGVVKNWVRALLGT